MEFPKAYDQGILYFFGALNRPWLDPVVGVMTRLGNPWSLAGGVVALACVFAWFRCYRFAVVMVCVGGLAAGLHFGVSRFVDRPRPDVSWRTVELPPSPCFPSGHAMGAMAVFLGGAILGAKRIASRRWAKGIIVFAVAVALLVGLTRTYLGVVYPLDVLAGWIGGLICALVGKECAGPNQHSFRAADSTNGETPLPHTN